jgi:two-component system phosphate regulon sensor histidine kinase PhoR
VKLRSPTTIFLHRARLIFVLTAVVPTVLMTAIGIVFLAVGGSKSMAVIGGILVLAFCATALVGYTLGTIFVTRGASLAALQNQFLSSVSHELRTPITSMQMFIETLRDDKLSDPAEKRRCLTLIAQELGRLDGLVGKLIALSKIESRHAAFERRPVDVSDVVDDALASFETVKFSSEVDLRVRVAPGLMVRGDRAALAQAVGDLLRNAWKYTRPEGKRIEIDAAGDDKQVTIDVADNGLGVAPPEQKAIFDKFHRGSAAVESGSPGTGLGLAIVRAVVQAHRGRIDVSSELGQGARFRITLPRSREAT